MLGAVIAAVWTGLLASAANISVHDIQGAAHASPLAGREVRGVEGVVTAVAASGFYLQEQVPDDDEATSEAVWVSASFTGRVGDMVRVAGTVLESRPGCAACSPGSNAYANLATTEIAATEVVLLAQGCELPAPVVIGRGADERAPPSKVVDVGVVGNIESGERLDLARNAIDFFESLEGMRVRVDAPRVVGATSRFSPRVAELVIHHGAGSGPFTVRGGLRRVGDAENPERIIVAGTDVDLPEVDVGDVFVGSVIGVLGYSFGNFKLIPTEPLPSVASSAARRPLPTPPSGDELTVATFNVENLSPRSSPAKLTRLSEILLRDLGAPDLVVLQEVQDSSGPLDDSTTDASETFVALTRAVGALGGPSYGYTDVPPDDASDGGAPGANIRIGFLYRIDRDLVFVDRPGAGPHTNNFVRSLHGVPELAFSPGRIHPDETVFVSSRKPVAIELRFRGAPLIAIGVHFDSQLADSPLFGRFQPPSRPSRGWRTEQARVVARFVRDILRVDPSARVLVLGDFNDVEGSAPLAALEGAGLFNLLETAPEGERYTSIFQGSSEALDHVLASPELLTRLRRFGALHVNADFADRPSDHDPVVARFVVPERRSPFSQGDGFGCAMARATFHVSLVVFLLAVWAAWIRRAQTRKMPPNLRPSSERAKATVAPRKNIAQTPSAAASQRPSPSI